jgi:hypothetical protein
VINNRRTEAIIAKEDIPAAEDENRFIKQITEHWFFYM